MDDEILIIGRHMKRDKMKKQASICVAIVIAVSMAGCASTSGMKFAANNQTGANNAQMEYDKIVCTDAGGDWNEKSGYCTN